MIKKHLKKLVKHFSTNKFTTLNHIEISSKRLLNNYHYFQKINPKYKIIPVLKSNAYGHGITQISKILNSADCELLAVDGYFEAAKMKDITNHKILVLGYIKPENYKLVDVKKCSFVIQDVDSLKALASINKRVNIHVELNTGMNRLGLKADELDEYLRVLKQYPKLNLEGVMTHLADADNDGDTSFTKNQVKIFDSLFETIQGQGFSPKYIHIAQTAGCLITHSKYANTFRLGIGLYGVSPLSVADKNSNILDHLEPIMEMKSTIIKTINLKVGDKVSYNGIFTANKPMKIGILPLGYYEGVPRELSNCGITTSGDTVLPIVGRVCMNHTMIDLDNSNLEVGDGVTIISNNPENDNSVIKICKKHKLFSYQLISNISESVRRIVI